MKSIALMVLAVFSISCRKSSKEVPPQDSGVLAIVVAESVSGLMKAEVAEFLRSYPAAEVRMRETSTREAIVQLLNDSVRTVGIDRRLNEEEQRVAREAGVGLVENRFAEDAITVVVHKENTLKGLRISTLRRMISGELTEWKDVPGATSPGSIEFVMTGRNSGLYELLMRPKFGLGDGIKPVAIAVSQQEAMQFVATHPAAMTLVSLAGLSSAPSELRVLGIATNDTGATGQYVEPSQVNVYHGLYPLHYSLYLYTVALHAGLGASFVTFVMKLQGQKVVQEAGLVPAEIPSRTIRITAE